MPVADRQPAVDEDVARAETALPVSGEAVEALLDDVERLFRLNPHLLIERFTPFPGGFHLAARNDSNGRDIATTVLVQRESRRLRLSYDRGLKRETRLTVEPRREGAQLVITEHYPRIEDPADPRVAEVDRSLVPWLVALRRHLLGQARWGRLPGWRWWQERVLLSLAPTQRRIVRLLVWITILEFFLFLVAILVLRLSA